MTRLLAPHDSGRRPLSQLPSSAENREIARRNIHHVDVHCFQNGLIESGRPLRPCENIAVGQRQFHCRCPYGSRFSASGLTHPPSARQCQPYIKSGSERAPLGHASSRRHFCRVQTCHYCSERVSTSPPILQVCFQLRQHTLTLQWGRASFGRPVDGGFCLDHLFVRITCSFFFVAERCTNESE